MKPIFRPSEQRLETDPSVAHFALAWLNPFLRAWPFLDPVAPEPPLSADLCRRKLLPGLARLLVHRQYRVGPARNSRSLCSHSPPQRSSCTLCSVRNCPVLLPHPATNRRWILTGVNWLLPSSAVHL